MKPDKDRIGYCLLGSSILLQYLEQLLETVKAVEKGEDPEAVHDMRVASRRLRASLAIFGENYSKKSVKAWRKEIKGVTRSLGVARDLDVQIKYLLTILENAPENARPALGAVLEFKLRERVGKQTQITNWLSQLDENGTLTGMQAQLVRDAGMAEAKGAHPRTRASFAAAQKHITRHIDEVLDYECFVHRPEMKEKHHRMRIAAKRLRYSMEAFSCLFKSNFAEEIEELKRLQDVLGEMHDTDVWIVSISDLQDLVSNQMNIPEDKLERGLDFLLRDRQDEKGRLYQEFVELWERLQREGLFMKIEGQIAAALKAQNEVPDIRESLKEPVKLALISDIHGNLQALNAVLEDAFDQGVIGFLNAGDSVGYGANPKEVLSHLGKSNVLSIYGNFDLKVINAAQEGKIQSRSLKKQVVTDSIEKLGEEGLSFLQSLPHDRRLQVNGKRLLMVHASPLDDDEHLYQNTPESRLSEIAQVSDSDIIVVGHSHVPFSCTVNGVLFINPGSVGRPADHDPRASYAILDTRDFSVSFRRLDYDIEAAIEAIDEARLPPAVGEMLRWGLSSAEGLEVGRAKPTNRSSYLERMETIEVMAKTMNVDFQHAQQVRKLAMNLFDQLKPIHGLRQPDRLLLEASSLLHDIGWSHGMKKHNWASFQMIMRDKMIPLDQDERTIVACIARYHRKRGPLSGDEGFRDLKKADKTRVLMLSSMLRIADGLDYSHDSVVEDISCEITNDSVILNCEVSGPFVVGKDVAQKKSDLFVETFYRTLIIHE